MAYIPVITTGVAPAVSIIVVGGYTYPELIAAMKTERWKVSRLLLTCNTFKQAYLPLVYAHVNANGNAEGKVLPSTVNNEQKQPVVKLSAPKKAMDFDGQSTLSMNLLPSETLRMTLYID